MPFIIGGVAPGATRSRAPLLLGRQSPAAGTSDTFDEAAFQRWYAAHARRWKLNPNPDDPQQQYDYRKAYRAGAAPDPKTGHWPSTFKLGGHPNLVVGGFHTQTGERVPGTPRAKNAAELERLGWDPEAAARLAAMPEPESTAEVVRRTQRDERRQR